MKRLVSFGKGQHTTDYIFATRLVGNSTWRPIWDYVIATEHTRVAQMRWPPRAVRQIKTDCLVLQPAKKMIPKLVAMCETRHCDLADLVQTHMGAEEGQRRLDEGVQLARSKDETASFAGLAAPN